MSDRIPDRFLTDFLTVVRINDRILPLPGCACFVTENLLSAMSSDVEFGKYEATTYAKHEDRKSEDTPQGKHWNKDAMQANPSRSPTKTVAPN
jgi:hypothetical protein